MAARKEQSVVSKGMTKDQAGYYKCDQCMSTGDFSKKDVYYVKSVNKVRCAGHGGSGDPFKSPSEKLGQNQ
jgi:hypothetical protein